MKINLLYSPLRLYFSESTKAINNGLEDSSNTEKALISNDNIEIKGISVIDYKNESTKVIPASYNRSDVKILLVEDDKTSRILISSLLKKERYQFDIVKNGWEAICAVEASKYDLILMDVNMPVLNGDEATEAIRKTNKQIPIVALTEEAICDERFQDKLFMGFNDVVSKSKNNELLLKTIRNLVTLSKRSIQKKNTFERLTWAS